MVSTDCASGRCQKSERKARGLWQGSPGVALKISMFYLICLVLLPSAARAQRPSEPNEGSRLIKLESGAVQFVWWGKPGNHYLAEFSTDFVNWTYVNTLFTGDDGVMGANIPYPGGRMFVRLQTDPLHTDSDRDGIPDGWEILYGLNPRNSNDAGIAAPGGLTYLQKYQFGLNPLVADTDGDGVPDGEDARPNDPSIGRLIITISDPTDGSVVP